MGLLACFGSLHLGVGSQARLGSSGGCLRRQPPAAAIGLPCTEWQSEVKAIYKLLVQAPTGISFWAVCTVPKGDTQGGNLGTCH